MMFDEKCVRTGVALGLFLILSLFSGCTVSPGPGSVLSPPAEGTNWTFGDGALRHEGATLIVGSDGDVVVVQEFQLQLPGALHQGDLVDPAERVFRFYMDEDFARPVAFVSDCVVDIPGEGCSPDWRVIYWIEGDTPWFFGLSDLFGGSFADLAVADSPFRSKLAETWQIEAIPEGYGFTPHLDVERTTLYPLSLQLFAKRLPLQVFMGSGGLSEIKVFNEGEWLVLPFVSGSPVEPVVFCEGGLVAPGVSLPEPFARGDSWPAESSKGYMEFPFREALGVLLAEHPQPDGSFVTFATSSPHDWGTNLNNMLGRTWDWEISLDSMEGRPVGYVVSRHDSPVSGYSYEISKGRSSEIDHSSMTLAETQIRLEDGMDYVERITGQSVVLVSVFSMYRSGWFGGSSYGYSFWPHGLDENSSFVGRLPGMHLDETTGRLYQLIAHPDFVAQFVCD